MTLSAQVINTGQNGIVGKTLDVKDKLFFSVINTGLSKV